MSAQTVTEIPVEVSIFKDFGEVSESDFEIPANHGSAYEYLLKESSIRFEQRATGITAVIDHLVRIRILGDDPIRVAEASLVGIPYYFRDNIEQVVNLEGITHQPNGDQVRFDADSIRTADLNSRYKIIEFEMPQAQEGSILEYKYTLERRYIEELPDFFFSHRVPTREAVVWLQNAQYLRYTAVKQNVDFEIGYEEVRVDTSSIPLVFTYRRPEPVLIQKWSAQNVPAVDASSYISSIDDIRARIRFQISEFGLPRQPLENSWEFVAAQIRRNQSPFEVVTASDSLRRLGKQIAESFSNKKTALDSIFHHVDNRVQFNEVNTAFADDSLWHVLNGEPANRAEINLVLLAMLRGAGIDAHPIYLSGREFGRIDRAFPSLFQFNRLLVYSEEGGEPLFMDAAFSHSLPNLIPVDSYNLQGMVLREESFEWVNIAPDRSVFDLSISVSANLRDDGTLEGTLRAESAGYPSRRIRNELDAGMPRAEILKRIFFDIYPETELSDTHIEVSPENRDKIMVEAQFTIPDYAVTFTEGIEFRPMTVGYLYRNPFESTERAVPITLDAPEMLEIDYEVSLPEGFRVEARNQQRETSLAGAALRETYETEENTIRYSFDIDISRKEFPTDVYGQLRRIYERWVVLSNETWFIENENS